MAAMGRERAFQPPAAAAAAAPAALPLAGLAAASLLLPLLALLLLPVAVAHAETITKNLEGGMDITITYPDSIAAGRAGAVSVLVSNNGWEDKQKISFDFAVPDVPSLEVGPPDRISIDRLAQGGSYGQNVGLRVVDDAVPGTHFLNIRYSQVLVANNEAPQEPTFHDMAIPITVKGDPDVVVYASVPESLFADAEFLIDVDVASPDVDITDVTIRVIPPDGMGFGGETVHTLSRIEAGAAVGITARIVTPAGEIAREHKLPFEVRVEYTDDVGTAKTDSQTIPAVLRPRTFMELTTDGGIWVGNFFIAPYVSLGTIIGIPAGLIVSLLVRRRGGGKDRGRSRRAAAAGRPRGNR